MVTHTERVAVLGGDGRAASKYRHLGEVRTFKGRRFGGNGELRRLERALKSRRIDRVVILTRGCGHSASGRALRLCRKLGVRVQMVP